MIELKPCPFYGGKAYIDTFGGNMYIDAFHKRNCIVKPDTFLCAHSMPIKKQIKAWNSRGETDGD